jgi:hypothetical protein
MRSLVANIPLTVQLNQRVVVKINLIEQRHGRIVIR